MMDHREVFREEAYELLAELETSLLELEEAPDNMEIIGRVFRAMHTIKGSGAMFGFDNIAKFTHEVETIFDLVRNGRMSVTKELINQTLASRDQIKAMLDASSSGGQADLQRGEEIISSLRRLVPGDCASGGQEAEKQAVIKKEEVTGEAGVDEAVTYRIRFKPEQAIFSHGTNPLLLLNELRELGDCSITAQMDAIPMLQDYNPELCYAYWDIVLTTKRDMNSIRDVFIFVEDDCELKIEVIDKDSEPREETGVKKLGEILVERGDVSQADISRMLTLQKKIGELLVDTGVVNRGRVEAALMEQQHVREVREKRQSSETATSIRVPSERLDSLVNLVGELVTVQAHLTQTASGKNDPGLTAIAEEVERLTEALRDNTMSLRMLQIGTTFSKFRRLVRDLSSELGKEIEMITEGAETELDKTVIEKLNDPLVHLIRNCIDHGIENPEERETAGKQRCGTIHLSAVHSGASVLINIRDDGKGLDAGALRQKGIEKGLISPDQEMTEREIFSLILLPGFSTAKKVSNISGRGVGMDVVKRAIDGLRGTIAITSQKGIGTTISLKLPLTLAIIEGLLVTIGDEYFVFPLSSVEECVELTQEDVSKAHGRHLANLRGQIIPYIRLREQFAVSGRAPFIEQIVIIGLDGQRVGFVVDNVIGEHQTVIKNLGRIYKDIDGISGATILGDGDVALILDIPRLVRMKEEEEALTTS